MMRYAAYTRLSKSDDDHAVSLDSQAEAIRRYVADRGEIVLEAKDIQSGLDSDRPGYLSILEAARAAKIDAAVVFRFDRWGRDSLEAARSIRELADFGVGVNSVTEGNVNQFVRDLFLLIANQESRTISARVRPVMTMQAKAGKWQARPPTGYDLKDGKLTPNSKAPLIRALFKRAVDGESIASLRRWAHSVGLTSPTGNPPSRSIVHKWLRNPAYVGDVVYNRESKGQFERHHKRPQAEWITVTDSHPALVDRATFAAVQTILAGHRQFQRRGSAWLLTGLARCFCGSRMYGRKGGKGTYTYYCYRGVDFGDCRQRFTGGATLDAWVKAQISTIEITPDLRQRAAEIVKAEAEEGLLESSRQRENLDAALGRHQTARKKLARRVMAATIPEAVYRELEEEEATAVHALEAELAKLETPIPPPDLGPIMDVLEGLTWDKLDDTAWREVAILLIEKVSVSGLNDYSLTWTEAGRSLTRVLERV